MIASLSKTAALVVIDVQLGFNDPDWGSRNNPEAEANIARLIAAWRGSHRPIHHVHHASQSPKGKFRKGSDGHAPKPEGQPLKGERVHVKTVNSGFIGTGLEQALREAGSASLVIVGLTTNHCVSTTARMAGNLGFDTYVVEDATAAFEGRALDGRVRPAEEVHSGALSDLSGEFAAIATTQDVLTALGGVNDH